MIVIADKAMRAFCLRRGWAVLPLRRVSSQAIPLRWGPGPVIPPWRGPWGPRIRRVRAPVAAGASTAGARAR
eukprot:8596542-Pyramimonas_sp.AAC.1